MNTVIVRSLNITFSLVQVVLLIKTIICNGGSKNIRKNVKKIYLEGLLIFRCSYKKKQ